MGRFDDRATQPARGPLDILKWRVVDGLAGKNRRDPGGFVTPRREPDRALVASGEAQLTWIGHATFLLTLGGKRVLFDPIFAPRIAVVKRLTPPGIALEELPPIDVVVVSHNHRDHLDPWTIERLGARPTYVAPLGNAEALKAAGAERVVELDWWGQAEVESLAITIVPARHWSMRFPWDRNDALWGGAVVRGPEGAAYHAGDTAFFDGFREIGERCGPIDWAMLPIGAYEPRWFMKPQHMNADEAAEAAKLVGARRFVAMHWGTFKLTDEPVGEPPEMARAAWERLGGDAEDLWILDVGETRRLA
ncbi:MAG TPA: MBL fold metallo-hydrolase [Byssovorax sp.]|jgi:L-ascorbate metabolism protein UlaG (beta-lactamase superfamily)